MPPLPVFGFVGGVDFSKTTVSTGLTLSNFCSSASTGLAIAPDVPRANAVATAKSATFFIVNTFRFE